MGIFDGIFGAPTRTLDGIIYEVVDEVNSTEEAKVYVQKLKESGMRARYYPKRHSVEILVARAVDPRKADQEQPVG